MGFIGGMFQAPSDRRENAGASCSDKVPELRERMGVSGELVRSNRITEP